MNPETPFTSPQQPGPAATPRPTTRRRLTLIALCGSAILIVLVASLYAAKTTKQDTMSNSTAAKASTSRQQAEISITDDGFVPSTLQVKQGTVVAWTNMSAKPHQIAADPYPTKTSLPSLSSASLSQNQEYHYTFNKPGTYQYHDQLNPTTTATIVVQ